MWPALPSGYKEGDFQMKRFINKYLLLSMLAVILVSGCTDYEESNFQYITSYDVLGGWHAATSLDGELDTISDFDDGLIQDVTKYSVQLFKVRYRTTYKGNPVTASGVVMVPASGKGPFPVVSYHHGTKFYDGETPSMFTPFNLEKETGWAFIIASAGFVCSVPDYLGFNESWDILHPYLLEEPSGTAAIDMLRATRELCDYINVKVTNRVFLTGYSEGGYTTMVVQRRIQDHHIAEFNLAGVSAGAGPYDLLTTADVLFNQATNVVPAYAPFLFSAYNGYLGWGRATAELFQQPFADRIDTGLYDGSHDMEEINSLLSPQPVLLYQTNFLSNFNGSGEMALKTALTTNSVHTGWLPTVPTRIYHGDADLTVPYTNSLILSNSFSGSANFSMHTLPGKNHLSGAIPFMKETLLWFLSL